MATQETQQLDAVIDNSRRKMLTLGGTALAGLALASYATKAQAAVTDADILNFALNLEYLEANFYNLAYYGVTIDKLASGQGGGPVSIAGGSGTPGAVTTKPNFTAVDFTSQPLIGNYAMETALEEAKHVAFLSNALGSAAVCQPALDLYTSFNTLATAGGINGGVFDPFSNPSFFILGAYIFEDVGVSAYHGAAPYISDKVNYLPPAVGIHAVEAYHAGLIRITIAATDAANGNTNLSQITQQITAVRNSLTATQANATGFLPPFDVGVTATTVALNGSSSQYTDITISNADQSTGAAGGRTTAQVLAIVTAGNSGAASGYNSGLFYPSGLNGNIR